MREQLGTLIGEVLRRAGITAPATEGLLARFESEGERLFLLGQMAKAVMSPSRQRLIPKQRCAKHKIVRSGDSATCSECPVDLGWWCQESPSLFCVYENGSENCIHCDQPEERK